MHVGPRWQDLEVAKKSDRCQLAFDSNQVCIRSFDGCDIYCTPIRIINAHNVHRREAYDNI